MDHLLSKYGNLVTCVLFYGGEWKPQELKSHLIKIRQMGLKTCLYTGSNRPVSNLLPFLDFIKIGRWVESMGGLESPGTNQRFYQVLENGILNDLTYLFGEK